MTRCSYIPPEGQSVIAIAKGRGGTTDGDIEALRDRFGCPAEAVFEMTADEDSDREQFSCVDHVGHLCSDGHWLVRPVYVPSDMPLTIVNTQGITRAGFGVPIILAAQPMATPVIDLDTNPTREQVRAAGFEDDSAAYREALRAFEPMPLPSPQTVGVARPTPSSNPKHLVIRPATGDPLILHPRVDRFPQFDVDTRTLRVEVPLSWDDAARLRRIQDERAVFAMEWLGVNMERTAIVSIAVRPRRNEPEMLDAEIDIRDIRVASRRATVPDKPLDMTVSPPPPDNRIDKVPCRADDKVGAFVGCLTAPATMSAPASTARGICDALLSTVVGVSAVCLVEHTDAELEVFVDGGDPDDIARCIYENVPVYIALCGQETGDIGDGTRIAFSRGAMETAAAHVPPRVRRCTFVGVGGAR